jgi:hypothetical protein
VSPVQALLLALLTFAYTLALVAAGAIPPILYTFVSVAVFVGGWIVLFLTAALTALVVRRPLVWGAVISAAMAGAICLIDQSPGSAPGLDALELQSTPPDAR